MNKLKSKFNIYKLNGQTKFNIFSFLSTFARSLIEIFISLYLYKCGYPIKSILLFYFIANFVAVPLSYYFVKLGEKTKYIYIMLIGIVSFVIVQVLLRRIIISDCYLILLAILYSIYRRGYWVSRRYYITKVMPTKNTSGLFSIILVVSQIATIAASFVGAYILDKADILKLTILSSSLLFISVIPLLKIEYKSEKNKIKLLDNLKKYKKSNYLVFSLYELNNLLSFIFPIYLAIYIKNTYSLVGSLNIMSNIAIIIFILFFGKLLKKEKKYIILSTLLVLLCYILKLSISNYFLLIISFIEGIVLKMQNQSINKVYFENRGDMDLTHYNLIYQMVECSVRALVTVPLFFVNDIRVMIVLVISIILSLLIVYSYNLDFKAR